MIFSYFRMLFLTLFIVTFSLESSAGLLTIRIANNAIEKIKREVVEFLIVALKELDNPYPDKLANAFWDQIEGFNLKKDKKTGDLFYQETTLFDIFYNIIVRGNDQKITPCLYFSYRVKDGIPYISDGYGIQCAENEYRVRVIDRTDDEPDEIIFL